MPKTKSMRFVPKRWEQLVTAWVMGDKAAYNAIYSKLSSPERNYVAAKQFRWSNGSTRKNKRLNPNATAFVPATKALNPAAPAFVPRNNSNSPTRRRNLSALAKTNSKLISWMKA